MCVIFNGDLVIHDLAGGDLEPLPDMSYFHPPVWNTCSMRAGLHVAESLVAHLSPFRLFMQLTPLPTSCCAWVASICRCLQSGSMFLWVFNYQALSSIKVLNYIGGIFPCICPTKSLSRVPYKNHGLWCLGFLEFVSGSKCSSEWYMRTSEVSRRLGSTCHRSLNVRSLPRPPNCSWSSVIWAQFLRP